ncbi:hypothetical protein HYT55_02755 [Candidatus Woesearchaeota archaeon]|nr:hypothetical protein [Candidatus Woesearchaeota archaeon]
MQKLKILNTREIKAIKELLVKEFGYALEENYAYLQNEKDRIFVVNRELAQIDLDRLHIDRLGLYFGEIKPGHLRLSKEGAQLLYHEARKNKVTLKNVLPLTKIETRAYFAGVDLKKDLGEENRLLIVTYEDDVLGCASYKERKIFNFLPKTHRGEIIL